MARTCLNGLILLLVTLGLASPVWSQGDRDRDRDGSERADADRDRERKPGDRTRDDLRDRPPVDGRGDLAPPVLRRESRTREDEEGTEEGMPQARMAPSGQPGARFAPPPWRPEWKLGVYAANTDTGVRVTRVLPRTPASQAGLERGDRILTVDGYQVGYIDGRLYPLGEELQRRAGRSGQVTLLLHNWRNGDLLNVEVRLDRQR